MVAPENSLVQKPGSIKNSVKSTTPLRSPIISEDVGLYIHIPFCARRCHFCAFYLVIQTEKRMKQFVDDLKKEMVLWASKEDFVLRKVSTVYFGGGTPTVLSASQLGDILNCVKLNWKLDAQAEVTVEATSESVSFDKLSALKAYGVTRVSMGVQTLVPHERETLGLCSETQPVHDAVQASKAAGLSNINLDLMYGLPGQTLSSWDDTVCQVLEMRPRHLSCYALSIEEGTRFYRQWEQGVLRNCDPEEEAVFQNSVNDQAQRSGLTRYEISNWAHPGYACRHNLKYWQGQDYLGFGPSAQSYVSGVRWGNVPDVLEYSGQLGNGQIPVSDMEVLDEVRQHKERVIFGLRRVEGIPTEWVDCLEHEVKWTQSLAQLLTDNLLSQSGNRYVLTERGRELADTVGHMLW
ncbi:MAG: radical SAM family heme chaperone HemW [Nitrospirales bacterium]|nr:radical SAM family heme chaperone HemW [Nitrospirales bacterium]